MIYNTWVLKGWQNEIVKATILYRLFLQLILEKWSISWNINLLILYHMKSIQNFLDIIILLIILYYIQSRSARKSLLYKEFLWFIILQWDHMLFKWMYLYRSSLTEDWAVLLISHWCLLWIRDKIISTQ